MKKRITAFLLAGCIVLTALLASCSPKLKYEDGGYYCAKNGVTYKLAELQYIPVTIGEKYAVLDDGGERTDLFTIQGASPEKWLTTEKGDLFYASSEKLPTLAEMDTDKILICTEGDAAVISLVEISNDANVDLITFTYNYGMEIEYPHEEEVNESLILRFTSEKYNWLYYNLTYVEFVIDVLDCDYPEDLSKYEYRDVDDSVTVTTVDEFECWYKVSDASEQYKYEQMAKDAGIDFFTVTKPTATDSETFVVFIFQNKNSADECIAELVGKYKGEMSEAQLKEALNGYDKTDKVTKVEYNYGKYFVYDKFTGKCVKVDDTLHKYRHYQISD